MLLVIAGCGKIQKNQSQEGENQGLNEAYEDFQSIKWNWRDDWYQEADYQE